MMMEEFENNVLRTEHLPQIHSEEFEKLPIRYRNIRWATCGLVALGVLLIFVALMVAGSILEPEAMDLKLFVFPTILWVIGFGAWGLSEWFGFDRRGYLTRSRDLSYRAGWLFHSITTVPFNRIQHSEVTQGPVAKRFKICTLKLYTAGSSGANLQITGLDEDVAKQLRQLIEERNES
jgi:membrane protein YdbS with pleckstrin-like domain